MVKLGVVCNVQGVLMVLYINVLLFVCGINIYLQIWLYFDDEIEVNVVCLVFNLIEQVLCCDILFVWCCEVDGQFVYCFDICIQGDNEMVFFDFQVY